MNMNGGQNSNSNKNNADDSVDERMFVSCVQTRQRRAKQLPALCHTVAIRYMGQVAASSASSAKDRDLATKAIPLPIEGNRESLTPARDAVVVGPATRYWRPGGTYFWYSSSAYDTSRHVVEMGLDENRQRQLNLAIETARRRTANWDRAMALHRLGKGPRPHTPRPSVPRPPDASTVLVDVTPDHLRAKLGGALHALYAPALRLAKIAVSESTHARLAASYAQSLRRNDAAQLWGLLGRVKNDYVAMRRKAAEENARASSSSGKEKAP